MLRVNAVLRALWLGLSGAFIVKLVRPFFHDRDVWFSLLPLPGWHSPIQKRFTYWIQSFTTTMAVTLTVLEQEFLARSSATIAAMDPSKVKNKTMEDDSSKQYKANKNRQGRRWGL